MAVDSFSFSYGSNPLSLRVQNNLRVSTNNLSRSYERLSSGLRINSASDDAAGLALATNMRTQEKLADVAVRNINDGISAVAIAQTALEQQKNILISLEELANAAANGSLSTAQQSANAEEYRALVEEYGRIGNMAHWPSSPNDIYLLAAGRGTNQSSITIQAGIDGTSNSAITIGLADTAELAGNIDGDAMALTSGVSPADASISTIATTFQNQMMNFKVVDSNGVQRNVTAGVSWESGTLTFSFYIENSAAASPPADATQWDYRSQATATYTTTTGAFNSSTLQTTIFGFEDGATAQLSVDLRGLKVSKTTGGHYDVGASTAIEITGVETSGRASAALTVIETKQTEIEGIIGNFNAAAARLGQAVNYMAIERENYGAAYSAITDVDVASEVANMVAEEIRLQGAQAVFAQANQQPQAALNLLESTLELKKAA
ncbi:MAG: hypothetical protein GYA55_12375 [SAR324 cluster bacterium]|uniref:Flagellin n=1 Tax=SAR324 cluster bacterium TaxID=2024889 RepID=A0A7X9FTC6_9DELT|nr:hypothetical protein [SAR324 cluster bacterium]